jgi:hypothetical protein
VTLPTIADVKEYYSGAAQFSDGQLSDVLASEAASQALVCTIPDDYPPDLRQALLRRVARALAMRALPLGMQVGDADTGPALLPGRDPEVRRLEAGHRRLAVG